METGDGRRREKKRKPGDSGIVLLPFPGSGNPGAPRPLVGGRFRTVAVQRVHDAVHHQRGRLRHRGADNLRFAAERQPRDVQNSFQRRDKRQTGVKPRHGHDRLRDRLPDRSETSVAERPSVRLVFSLRRPRSSENPRHRRSGRQVHNGPRIFRTFADALRARLCPARARGRRVSETGRKSVFRSQRRRARASDEIFRKNLGGTANQEDRPDHPTRFRNSTLELLRKGQERRDGHQQRLRELAQRLQLLFRFVPLCELNIFFLNFDLAHLMRFYFSDVPTVRLEFDGSHSGEEQ